MKCLLPEIIDSRKARGMPIRNVSLQDNKIVHPEENENVDPNNLQLRQSTNQLHLEDF